MADFEIAYSITKDFEGGYQSKASDPGNYCDGNLIGTNRGISAPTFKSYYGYCPTVMQMINLTEEQAKPIYRRDFWNTIRGDQLVNQNVANMLFDMFVNHPGYGKGILRRAIANQLPMYTTVERPFTDDELSAINRVDQMQLFNDVRDGREAAYREKALEPGMEEYLDGCLRRLRRLTWNATYKKPFTFVAIALPILALGFVVYFYLTRNKRIKL